MTTPSVAVVICAYTLDRWDELFRSITSVVEQSLPPTELVLVVDHNQELFDRATRELSPQFACLQVIVNKRRQGLSGARNTGIGHLTSEIVVFLDDDASADPGWLLALVRHYQDALVVGVGGVARPGWPIGEGRPVTLPARNADDRGELDWVVGCTYTGQPQATEPVRNLMGCNMSFRREVFGVVGGFCEDLGRVGKTPLGCEETELCIRVRNAQPGTRIIFEPQASVRHQVTRERLGWRYLSHRCYAEGLSKAAVSRMVGSDQALETERRYVTHILSRALVRELAQGVAGTPTRSRAFGGAAAILLALVATVCGYGRARLASADVLRAPLPPLILRTDDAAPEGSDSLPAARFDPGVGI